MNNRQFLIVIIVTFVIIIIWIIADIIHTRPSIEVNPKLSTLLSPLNPNFDSKVIDQIKEVTPVEELTISSTGKNRFSNNSTRSAQPTVSPVATPLPFPSGLIPVNASASAVPGGSQ
jgi:hypothetical protein